MLEIQNIISKKEDKSFPNDHIYKLSMIWSYKSIEKLRYGEYMKKNNEPIYKFNHF